MPREVWSRVKPPNSEPILLDLGTTPLQDISEPDVYAVAAATTGPEYRVSIYRPDIKDVARGFPINTDHYSLWEGFPEFLDLGQIVNYATTDLDANVTAYVNERVFLIKQRPADDHWLRDYPPHVRLLVERSGRR